MEDVMATKEQIIIHLTLSELINACGDNFGYLQFTNSKRWRCGSSKRNIYCQVGTTPEEAVASLLVELDKNK